MYSTRAIFHLMKDAKDPLYEQMLDKDYKFSSMEHFFSDSATLQEIFQSILESWWQRECFSEGKEEDGKC